MAQPHPHADASYRVVPHDGFAFAVEVNIPGNSPALVTRFETVEKAEAWITDHVRRVEEGTFYRSSMRRNMPRPPVVSPNRIES